MAWTPFTTAGPAGELLPDDVVTYGPDIPTEAELRLLGDVSGKRIVDLGCGAGRNSVAMARNGARVIALDEDPEQVALARVAAEAADVRVELHQGPLADLAFLRADTIDGVLSVGSLPRVGDIGRLFRQIHRVLHPKTAFVMAVPHPTLDLLDPASPDPLRVRRSAFDDVPFTSLDPRNGTTPRTMSALFTALHRAGFSIDTVAEPAPAASGQRSAHWSPAMTHVPSTLILRARKEGL